MKTFLLILALLVTVTIVVRAQVHDRPANDRGVPNGCMERRAWPQDATGLSCGPAQLDDGLL